MLAFGPAQGVEDESEDEWRTFDEPTSSTREPWIEFDLEPLGDPESSDGTSDGSDAP